MSKSLDNQSKQGGNGIIRFDGRARSPSRAKSTKSKASVSSSPRLHNSTVPPLSGSAHATETRRHTQRVSVCQEDRTSRKPPTCRKRADPVILRSSRKHRAFFPPRKIAIFRGKCRRYFMARNRSEKYWFVCITFRTIVGIIPLFSLGDSLIDLIVISVK